MEGRYELYKRDGVWCIRLTVPRWMTFELQDVNFKCAGYSILAGSDEQHPSPITFQHWDGDKLVKYFTPKETKMPTDWKTEIFDDRELNLWENVKNYTDAKFQAGLPGHNLMVMMAKMGKVLDEYEAGKRGVVKYQRDDE